MKIVTRLETALSYCFDFNLKLIEGENILIRILGPGFNPGVTKPQVTHTLSQRPRGFLLPYLALTLVCY